MVHTSSESNNATMSARFRRKNEKPDSNAKAERAFSALSPSLQPRRGKCYRIKNEKPMKDIVNQL
jgi:hypothetical protein